MEARLHIKNMVCPRCISAVETIFSKMGIGVISVRLGEVITQTKLSETERGELQRELFQAGFELLEDKTSKLIARVKSIIIAEVHHAKSAPRVNFSTLLSEELAMEYTAISKLFSSVEGITIERYVLKQKIEKVKELLFYDQLTLSEIAHQMNYSSVAHLSSQFKKETGMTTSQFKASRQQGRQFLDAL